MRTVFFVLLFSVFSSIELVAQSKDQVSYDSLKREIIQLDQELYDVQLNLHQAQNQLQTGILVATLGYTVTIIGGQLLGTKPELGETLLYVGGATGIVGTVILFKGFKKISLGPPLPRNR
ncbi:hypothetical protein [Algoriphagus sp.]|uniref:hypothetical protein n=1 Tax=Algoriphagus sp. TaxID=1872435 RepID=UPI00391B7844